MASRHSGGQVQTARITGLIVVLIGTTSSVARVVPVTGSIQQLMIERIDPAADALWGAVGIEEIAAGTHVRAPRGDAEWQGLRQQAQTLILGAAALKTAGLAVGGRTHGRLADAGTPGIRSATDIRRDIDREPARFVAAADRLQRAGDAASAAIAAHDAGRLTEAGAAIDAACEGCHAAYWYPRRRLTLPSSAAFGRIAGQP